MTHRAEREDGSRSKGPSAYVDVEVSEAVFEDILSDSRLHPSIEPETIRAILSEIEPFVQRTVQRALSQTVDARAPLHVSIAIVSDPEIRELNSTWRNLDRATDVLSFPQLEPDELEEVGAGQLRPARDPALPDGPGREVLPDQGPPVLLGDVVISPRTVLRRADRADEIWRELARVLIHGLLHLQGWAHDKPKDRRAMREKEASILSSVL